ncbi:phasin family protein [Eilatimonas milleporae]|uniref:Phasin family protein n=1 Tax=Eilatimonas milleporae TaxID=911205 RepID=A0A3M0CJA2_9PROT|nr:phasin family protein [Eilatimonas milleporae]RMB08490.1 phasin family protein [Eilatimonas milleporae]
MTTKTESTATKKAANGAKKGFDAFADMFSAPAVDVNSLFEFQRKNVEATVEANRIVFDGMKNVAQHQIDMAKDNLAELNELASTSFMEKTPENGMSSGMEAAQDIFRKNMTAAREAGDVAVEASQKAIAVLQKRYEEGVKELQASAK